MSSSILDVRLKGPLWLFAFFVRDVRLKGLLWVSALFIRDVRLKGPLWLLASFIRDVRLTGPHCGCWPPLFRALGASRGWSSLQRTSGSRGHPGCWSSLSRASKLFFYVNMYHTESKTRCCFLVMRKSSSRQTLQLDIK